MNTERLLDRIIGIPEEFHEAGTLSPTVLRKLYSFTRHGGIERSVETGCGKSTLLLSWVSKRHTVFTLAEYPNGEPSSGYKLVSESSLLNSDSVDFVLGPSQQTLPRWTDRHPIQLAFIDGPHGYPFPELEYYNLYPRLETDALLVIDDIQIPTIGNLFQFLSEDRMFSLEEVVGNTAFFRRTAEPLFDPLADNWETQEYNLRRRRQPGNRITNVLHKLSKPIRRWLKDNQSRSRSR